MSLSEALTFYFKVKIAPAEDRVAVGSDHIDWLVREAQEAQGDLKEACELLTVADCPQCKDKSGAYYNNDGSVSQCQWCFEVNKLKGKIK